jgi:NAD(P)-dependent dehydrogenase (short-subunit alcohol dehydrogenase family)
MQVNNPFPKEFEHDKTVLAGKNILITGAASDLGNSLCRGLARAGAIVLMMDRREKNMTNLYDDLVAEGCAEPMIVALDHTKSTDEHMDTLASALSQQITALHGLVHLPLTAAPLTPFTLTKTETWVQSWELLFLQPMLLTRALIPLLDKSEDGSVVFSTLDSGRLGKAYWGIPGAAYAAIENLSQSLSHEYQDIRFNTLEPGKVNTALRHKYYPAEAKSELRSFDDIYLIDHFIFLLSNQAKNLTGQQLKVPNLS